MSPSDDALDFLDSLLIFDRICPFALEHLPAMSRRVFDVGLDMGRIRNGLKPNKESRRGKSHRSNAAAAATATQDQKAEAYAADTMTTNSEQLATVVRIKPRKSSPTVNPENMFDHGQPDDTVVLPSVTPRKNPDLPMPPSARSSQEYVSEERSLHSSQLNPSNDRPATSQKAGHTPRPSDVDQGFDLRPPPPNSKMKRIDTLSEMLFSGNHLKVILKDPSFFLRFTAFLNRYKPKSAPVLVRYLEAQKAVKALEYANALAASMTPAPGEDSAPRAAAPIDPQFKANSQQAFESLINEALPAYITNCLTKVVTETMVREITGTGMPVMRELVGGLAEVFCLADPSKEDCPIVYASEEFYRTTRYSRDDVIGRNCRFLQGPKTDRRTIARLKRLIDSGQECCETLLNYKRDGTPFMNLFLNAPLYDNRGIVRYFIGAQIDVSGLIEEGRGLDSFERLLAESRAPKSEDSEWSEDGIPQKHLKALSELNEMLSMDESSLLQRHGRESSATDRASSVNFSYRRPSGKREPSVRNPRRILGNEENENREKNAWALVTSGRLPGVYQNYLLVRPYPSLRIIFVSPALRIPGLLQSQFLSRIGGPAHVKEGLSEAFEQGAAVTAKVSWLPHGAASDDGDSNSTSSRPVSRKSPLGGESGSVGGSIPKTRYISCTPLLGSDDHVGVWMVVMVENELVTGTLASRERALARYHDDVPLPSAPFEYERDDSQAVEGSPHVPTERNMSGAIRDNRRGNERSENGRFYADYMRGIGASGDGGLAAINGDAANGAPGEGHVEELLSPVDEKQVF